MHILIPNQSTALIFLEHRGIELLLDSLECLAVDENIIDAISCIDVIIDFYIGHFQNEEKLMTELKYKNITKHLSDHTRILNFFIRRSSRIRKG